MDYAEFIAQFEKVPHAARKALNTRTEYELDEAQREGVALAFAWISTLFDAEPYRAGPGRSDGKSSPGDPRPHLPQHS